ncbi:MAG TPA: lipid II flippase MurJ, partial [Microbacteriaceae bacterium]|nr:lipid II flippase MurJ [Microbacteriaceae bacterium]
MASLGRASVLLASGTVVSRILGFVRAAVLAAAIGAFSEGANAFGIANQLPNNIYTIIASGILSAVLVPQIVRANGHKDGGKAYINKIFTIALVVLLIATLAAILLAPALMQLYTRGWSDAQLALGTAMAYWCLPQIFFYGLYALLGEVLNARKVFGPFTWAPIINNVVALAGLGAFILIFGLYNTDTAAISDWTPDRIALLGGLTTLGVAAQALILLVWWRRAGLSFRPDFHWRGVGLRSTGKLAGWTFAMVITGQLAGIVQSQVSSLPAEAGYASVFVMSNAWLIFMLPHSIIAVSIGTAYFTQLSEHAV